MPRPLLGLTAALALLASSGCFNLDQALSGESAAEEAPAESLGSFTVAAALTSQSCGTGTLALPANLEFVVELSKPEEGGIRWGDGSATLDGKLESDGVTFAVATVVTVDARAKTPDAGMPPCSIVRTDIVRGKLDKAETPGGFVGGLELDYEPAPGSDCRDLLVGPERLTQALPCKARYELSAHRKE